MKLLFYWFWIFAIINHHRALRLKEGNLLKGDLVNLPHLKDKDDDDDNGPSHAEIIKAAQDKIREENKETFTPEQGTAAWSDFSDD